MVLTVRLMRAQWVAPAHQQALFRPRQKELPRHPAQPLLLRAPVWLTQELANPIFSIRL
jgi:hypothetical protein